MTRIALLAIGLTGLLLSACAPRYYDHYGYGHHYYGRDHRGYGDRDHDRDRRDYDRQRDYGDRY